MNIDEILDKFPDVTFKTLDGFDAAILGVLEDMNKPPRLVYSRAAILGILQVRDDMNYDDALEYYEFNISGAWIGDDTPALLYDDF